jgi:hypothetical protein
MALVSAQSVQIHLPTNNGTHTSGLIVDPTPTEVKFFYSFQVYPKWVVTFSIEYSSPVGDYSSGIVQVQVAGDWRWIDHVTVLGTTYNWLNK